jgi:hypothetical protein
MDERTLKSCQFGITSYLKKGPFNVIKSKFGADSSSGNVINNYYMEQGSEEDSSDYDYYIVESMILFIAIVSMVLGFVAVNRLCDGTSERAKNTRLGMYLLLILSGGLVGWAYILMWILGISVC